MPKLHVIACLLSISASAMAEEPVLEFVLPKLEKKDELKLTLEEGFLAVDGILSQMPETQLSQDTYKVLDDLYLIHNPYLRGETGLPGRGYNKHVMLWDKAKGKPTELLEGSLIQFGQAGWLVHTRDKSDGLAYLAVNPKTRRFVELWKSGPHAETWVEPAGHQDSTLCFLLMGREKAEALLWMESGKAVVKTQAPPAGWAPHYGDGIRNGRLLLYRLVGPPGTRHGIPTKGYPTGPPEYEIAYWDLERHKLTVIDRVTGWWMPKGGLPDAMLSLSWFNQEKVDKFKKTAWGAPFHMVHPETFKLTTLK